MVKLAKRFEGVPNGEIYPVTYEPGDECPEELLGAAIAMGVVDDADAKAKAAEEAAAAKAKVDEEAAAAKAKAEGK